MSNFKRKKPKPKKGPRENWGHKPELDPEPEVSKTGPASEKRKKGKKKWLVTGVAQRFWRKTVEGRSIYGRYHTEAQAEQARKAQFNQTMSWASFTSSPERKAELTRQANSYRVEYDN